MSPCKLHYFNIKGLGEPIRYMLSYMNVEFEDVRSTREDWMANPEKKKAYPFGKLPVLEMDGKVLTDSQAICRYLASKAGLLGANPEENLNIDMVAGAIGDIPAELRKLMLAKTEEEKATNLKHMQENIMPFYFERFEKLINDNGGYLANGKLSWVDIYHVAASESMETAVMMDLPKLYPGYGALKQKVMNLPGIKEYIAKRPASVA